MMILPLKQQIKEPRQDLIAGCVKQEHRNNKDDDEAEAFVMPQDNASENVENQRDQDDS
jgi:hypothetical protein